MSESELFRSAPPPGVIKGTWLGSAIAVAVCAATFRATYPPYGAIATTAFVLVTTLLLVARNASRHEGSSGALFATVPFAGTLPAFIVVSLYAATRPLIAIPCTEGHCYPTLETIVSVGAGVTIVPLVVSSLTALWIARRYRPRIARLIPIVAACGMLIATIVAGIAAKRGLAYPTTDSYLATVPEVGRINGAVVPMDRVWSNPVLPKSTPPIMNAKWTYEGPAQPSCNLSIAGGGYNIQADEVGTGEIVCPAVLVRHDASRGIVVVEAARGNGSFRPAFAVETKNGGGVSGPLYADGYELPRVAPAGVWIIFAAAGVLGAIALVIARLRDERSLVAQWRAAPIGKHRGDGWVAFDDDTSPPLNIPSARELPVGDVRVLGVGKSSKADYRSSGAASSGNAVAADLATVERSSRERSAATIAVFGLVAFIAATPVGAGLFLLLRE